MVPRQKSKAPLELTTVLKDRVRRESKSKERESKERMTVVKKKRNEKTLFWKEKKKKKIGFSPKREECKTPEFRERYITRLAKRKNKNSTSSVSNTQLYLVYPNLSYPNLT
jgi:hypothetical protein